LALTRASESFWDQNQIQDPNDEGSNIYYDGNYENDYNNTQQELPDKNTHMLKNVEDTHDTNCFKMRVRLVMSLVNDLGCSMMTHNIWQCSNPSLDMSKIPICLKISKQLKHETLIMLYNLISMQTLALLGQIVTLSPIMPKIAMCSLTILNMKQSVTYQLLRQLLHVFTLKWV
jgi:hypothetical protein